MKYPNINIYAENGGDFEARYLCFLAKGISMDEYQNGGFLVTPTLVDSNGKSVHFPRLKYSRDFWKGINSNSNINLSNNFSTGSVSEAKDLLKKYNYEKYEGRINQLKTDWTKIEKPFFDMVNEFLDFGDAIDKVNRIDILVTPFGTKGSFNPPRVGNKFNLLCTSRVDFPAGNIAAVILQNLYIIKTNIGGEINDEKYLKRMATIAFLFENTPFKKFYPEFKNILKTDFNVNQELVRKSNKYLKELGFLKEVVVNPEDKIFTTQESELLKVLIKNKGSVVSFDSAAKALWGKDSFDKFSLEAMAKVIENIRKKIRLTGINKELIFTKRGKGYILN